ncbi:C-type lectin lectoxin-Lio3-like [Haliotis rufescens]|uniref:C-type lectin lectoxin-Lio3-like n=1 Tax=Haliotis rufescens TaxID=6454 RepID=UPI001EB0A4ED|nr:C-type lectin lectoxin-Lio3-like [Haliotis rufescens]
MGLAIVVVLHGMFLASLPPGVPVSSRGECVYRCYYQKDCSSLFYDVSTNLCQLSTEVYLERDLTNTPTNMQYLVWRRDDCGNDYTWYRTLGLCYKIYTSIKTWFKVNTTCHQDGGYPVKVDSAGINALVNKISDSYSARIWLGGFQVEKLSGIWTWPDGSVITPAFWDETSNQPDRGISDQCILVQSGSGTSRRWHDAPCTWAALMFVCQRPLKEELYCWQ